MNVWLGFVYMLDTWYHEGYVPKFIGRKICDHYESFYK